MSDFLKRNGQFLIVLWIWVVSGMYAGPVFYAVIPVSLILFKQKNLYPEMLIGFVFLLTLSDNYTSSFSFAGKVKDIYLVLLSVFMLFDRKSFPYKNNFFPPYIPFFIAALLMISRSYIPMDAFQKTLSYFLLFLILPVYFKKVLTEYGPLFIKDYIYVAVILLLWGLVKIPFFYDEVYLVGRYKGLMGNPNALGLICALIFLLVATTKKTFPDLFSKWEVNLIYIIILIPLVLSNSRNSLFAIVIFMLFSRFYNISYWYGFAIVIISAIAFELIEKNITEILNAVGLGEFLRTKSLKEGGGRIIAWTFAWKYIQTDFFLGRGFNFDGWLFAKYQKYLNNLGHVGGVHSSYLSLWLCTSLFGLILYLAATFVNFFRLARKSALALPLLYAFLFSAAFESWLMGSLNPYTIQFLLIVTIIEYASEQKEENPVPVL